MALMTLCVVAERLDPSAGGNERSTWQIVQALSRRGHRVHVITGYCPDGLSTSGVEIQRLFRHPKRRPWAWYQFVRWAHRRLAESRANATLSMTMAVAANVVQPRGGTVRETLERNIAMRPARGARVRKKLLVMASPKQRALLRLERRTVNDPRVKRIIAVSQYVADQLQRHYQVDPVRVEMIPNAAIAPRVTDNERAQWRDKIRRGLNIPQQATVYLFAAFNPRLKGAATLINAAARLSQQDVDWRLIMAGRTGYGLLRQVTASGLRDRVRLLGSTNQMPRLYAAADVTVLPTYYDPSSKVVIESLMMGTPAISTAFNGASDFIVPPKGQAPRGRVIADPSDADALAQAMAELAQPQHRQPCIDATRGLADELSMARHVDRLEAVLFEVAGRVEPR